MTKWLGHRRAAQRKDGFYPQVGCVVAADYLLARKERTSCWGRVGALGFWEGSKSEGSMTTLIFRDQTQLMERQGGKIETLGKDTKSFWCSKIKGKKHKKREINPRRGRGGYSKIKGENAFLDLEGNFHGGANKTTAKKHARKGRLKNAGKGGG